MITNVLLIFVIILMVFEYILITGQQKKLKQLKRRYDRLLRGLSKDINIEDAINELHIKNQNIDHRIDQILRDIQKERAGTMDAFVKNAFIQYSAFDTDRTKQSFSLCMLDNKENGFVLTNIYSENGANLFAKKINRGKFEKKASPEEQKVLQLAKHNG